jgi:hypothetical protein
MNEGFEYRQRLIYQPIGPVWRNGVALQDLTTISPPDGMGMSTQP